jgi:hypothetical protein
MNTRQHPDGCGSFLSLRSGRRTFLRAGVLGLVGLPLHALLRAEAVPGPKGSPGARAQNVIQIFLPGGCAHQESWDPKPEAPLEYRGALGVVKTVIPGVVFSQNLQKCAAIADRLTVLRGIAGRIPDHGQATYHVLTGYTPTPAIQHPQMGAVVAHELGGMQDLPPWVGVPACPPQASTGYLPAKYGCFQLGTDPGKPDFRVRDVSLPGSVSEADYAKRRSLREVVEEQFRSLETDGVAQATMDEFHRKAYGLLSSPKAQAAFSMNGEPDSVKSRYGCQKYRGGRAKQVFTIGERLILARRLVEAGARFVTVQYEGDNGWDTHTRISDYFSDAMPAFDHALAGLILDLEERGLLDSTLVMVMTEFGRTPKVNASAGRDHHAKCFSMVLAGGGTTRGNIFGASDAIGAEPARDAVTVEEFLATAYALIGVDPAKRLMAPGERPIDIIREARVVKGILA